MSFPKVWFITGASSGFGRVATETILKEGHIVVATARTPESLNDLTATYSADRLLILRVDVTKLQDIIDAFTKVKEAYGRLDVVFNNAGSGALGELEGTPDEVARAMFETNFWGAANVSREAVKFFRDVNKPGIGGRLLNMSSGAGLVPLPCFGFYCATKHALEGLTQSLAHELDPEWNIKVTLIEPGDFRTRAHYQSLVRLEAPPAYRNPSLPSKAIRDAENSDVLHGSDPRKAVKKIYELASLPDPPLRFIVGKDCIELIKGQLKVIQGDLERYESWSNDLGFDE